jgi:hypothetical protein
MTDYKDGETDLDHLLRNMEPILEEEELVFCSLPSHEADDYLAISQGYYIEREGTTLILGRNLADLKKLSYHLVFKRITLSIHSSLEAVGFLARITEVLAAQGISVNVISAFYHDYLYIKSSEAEEAVNILRLWQDKLSDEG